MALPLLVLLPGLLVAAADYDFQKGVDATFGPRCYATQMATDAAIRVSAAAVREVEAEAPQGLLLVQTSARTGLRIPTQPALETDSGAMQKVTQAIPVAAANKTAQPSSGVAQQAADNLTGNTSQVEMSLPKDSHYHEADLSQAPLLHMHDGLWQLFSRRLGQEEKEDASSLAAKNTVASFDSWPWTIGFVFTLVFVGALLWHKSKSFEVDVPEETDEDLAYVKGRPCCNSCCISVCLFAVMYIFFVVQFTTSRQNKDIEKHPYHTERKIIVRDGHEHEEVNTFTTQLINPYQCAYLASLAVMSSLAIAYITIMAWRKYGNVQITTSLLCQFTWRGASLSILIALLLEVSGMWLMMDVAGFSKNSWKHGRLGSAIMFLVVGFSEEFAKLIAVTCGSCLTVAALADTSGGCCCGNRLCCQVLVENRRSLALAGLAAGYGFMTVENLEYGLAVLVKPKHIPVGEASNGKMEDGLDTEDGLNTLAIAVIVFRVLMNIHPWLCGVSISRIAQVVFDGDGEHTTACLSPKLLLWAVLPSALAHALYDFMLVACPLLGILLVPLVWHYGRRAFWDLWLGGDGLAPWSFVPPSEDDEAAPEDEAPKESGDPSEES